MPLPHKWPFKADPDFTYYQELVRMKPSQYVCPLMPFPLFDPANVFPVQFGPENQTANFLIDSSLTYLSTLHLYIGGSYVAWLDANLFLVRFRSWLLWSDAASRFASAAQMAELHGV